MTRKEIVKRAIHFQHPERIPEFFFSGNADNSDVVKVDVENWHMGPNNDEVEWGFVWNNAEGDKTDMGTPKEYILADWSKFENYKKNIAPDPFRKGRFDKVQKTDFKDCYRLGSLFISGFSVMMLLRGFENVLMDMYDNPERVYALADLVFGIENDIIRQMKEQGFDGVFLLDDWGMQKSMMISPELWEKFFMDYYKKQFQLAHDLGMDVLYHTCGYVYPIIQKLIDIGVDIINLGQADLNDMALLKENFKGKVCFCQPINYQTTGISGTKEQIFAEARDIVDTFSDERGGLLIELLDFNGMGWEPKDPKNNEYQFQAFKELLYVHGQ